MPVLVVVVIIFAIKIGGYKNPLTAKETDENLIVLIGDGMGPAQVTLARLYGQEYMDMERLSMDNYLVGMNSTRADHSPASEESGIVTDSAASGTAFATGNKTYNGAISVTNEDVAKPVASILEAAKDAGKGTGLISTTRITHATPAVYASHVRDRDNENAIASQYVDADIDVFIGGGERHFVGSEAEAKFGETAREDGGNLIDKFEEKGYQIAHNQDELQQADGDKLLALLSDSHVPYNLDREEDFPSLKEQLEKAIEILEKNDEGFVIMIEGGRIDHAGHANDIHSVVQELIEFDEAFEAAVQYAEESGNTSVIATADHETGGLTIGSEDVYDAYLDVIEPITASSEKIGEELQEAQSKAEIKEIVETYTGINDLSNEEVNQIKNGERSDHTPSSYESEGAFNDVISQRSMIGWTGHGHTGVDVGVYGYGSAAELLTGFNDNTDFAKAGATALGLDLDKATEALQEKFLYPTYKETADEVALFPVDTLQEPLNFKVEKGDTDIKVEGNKMSFSVAKDANVVDIKGDQYEVLVDQDQLYVPIDLLAAVTKENLQWDALSERIILE